MDKTTRNMLFILRNPGFSFRSAQELMHFRTVMERAEAVRQKMLARARGRGVDLTSGGKKVTRGDNEEGEEISAKGDEREFVLVVGIGAAGQTAFAEMKVHDLDTDGSRTENVQTITITWRVVGETERWGFKDCRDGPRLSSTNEGSLNPEAAALDALEGILVHFPRN
ncbi:MAG: hypothetical protein AAB839_01625 [Patescibacteria group bacterium]